jgi:hypothetical protein
MINLRSFDRPPLFRLSNEAAGVCLAMSPMLTDHSIPASADQLGNKISCAFSRGTSALRP